MELLAPAGTLEAAIAALQYGADAMAVMGSTFPEILSHYYPGTTLTRLDSPQTEG